MLPFLNFTAALNAADQSLCACAAHHAGWRLADFPTWMVLAFMTGNERQETGREVFALTASNVASNASNIALGAAFVAYHLAPVTEMTTDNGCWWRSAGSTGNRCRSRKG